MEMRRKKMAWNLMRKPWGYCVAHLTNKKVTLRGGTSCLQGLSSKYS